MSKMNTAIVATYGFTGKYNGLIMASSKVIAVLLSAFSIVSAMVTMSLAQHAGQVATIEAGVAGFILAILIEGITLVCLSLIRSQYLRAHRSADEQIKHQCNVLIWWLAPFAGLGILLSAAAGDLFWHQVLSSQSPYMSIPLSIAFALVISLTFLIGELFALLIDKNMEEEMSKGRTLRKVAFASEHADMQLVLMRESYRELLNDKNERDAIKQDLRAKLKVGLLAGIAQINIEEIVNADPQIARANTEEVLLLEEGDDDGDVKSGSNQVTNSNVKSASSKTLHFNNSTAQLVATEYARMLTSGAKPTQSAIANTLGLTRQTVAPHFNALVTNKISGGK